MFNNLLDDFIAAAVLGGMYAWGRSAGKHDAIAETNEKARDAEIARLRAQIDEMKRK